MENETKTTEVTEVSTGGTEIIPPVVPGTSPEVVEPAAPEEVPEEVN